MKIVDRRKFLSELEKYKGQNIIIICKQFLFHTMYLVVSMYP